MRTLPLSRSDLRSNLQVGFDFLRVLWKKGRRRRRRGPTYTQARELTHARLRGVDPGQSPHAQVFIHELDDTAVHRGWLHESAGKTVREWYR